MKYRTSQFIAAAGLLAIALSLPVDLRAEDEDNDGRKFSLSDFTFRLGLYDISSDTLIRLDGNRGNFGTTISLEGDLNMDDRKSTFYGSISWRMSGRHYLELEQFRLARSGVQTLSAEIEFGDEVFEIGTAIDSYFNTQVTRISYSYLVHDSSRFVVALSGGLHVTDLATGITETSGPIGIENAEFADVTAPLPVLGVSGAWRMSEKWVMYGRAQFFRLQVSDYKGSLDHASVKLEYNAFKHLGIGVGFDLFDLKLDIQKRFWNGTIDFEFRGPMIYLKGNF